MKINLRVMRYLNSGGNFRDGLSYVLKDIENGKIQCGRFAKKITNKNLKYVKENLKMNKIEINPNNNDKYLDQNLRKDEDKDDKSEKVNENSKLEYFTEGGNL